jgi:hypothetical protein
MLAVADQVVAALRSSHVGGVRAVASYAGRQTSVRLKGAGELRFVGDAVVQGGGRVSAFGRGDSLVPKSPTDPLSAFGQEMALWRTVRARGVTWEIPLGIYRITGSGNTFERFRGEQVVSWSVDVDLADRFEQIEADDFLSVTVPRAGATVWSEVRRLSPIPIQARFGDAAVPPRFVYESRIDAITQLLALLGAVPHLTREGVLTARLANVWASSPAVGFEINGVVDWADERSNTFINQVRTVNPEDASIVGYAQLTDDSDPRSVRRAGGRTATHSSPIYTTKALANAGARTELRNGLNRRTRVVNVECTPEALLLELGDFGRFVDPVQRRSVVGEVVGIRVPLSPTRPVAVDVLVSEDF